MPMAHLYLDHSMPTKTGSPNSHSCNLHSDRYNDSWYPFTFRFALNTTDCRSAFALASLGTERESRLPQHPPPAYCHLCSLSLCCLSPGHSCLVLHMLLHISTTTMHASIFAQTFPGREKQRSLDRYEEAQMEKPLSC